MGKGGARLGAGRPKGTVDARCIAAKADAMRKLAYEGGELPHQFLLRVARGEEIDGYTFTPKERVYAAIAAAPYFAPRLASVEQKVEAQVHHTISAEPLTPDQWDQTYGESEEVITEQ